MKKIFAIGVMIILLGLVAYWISNDTSGQKDIQNVVIENRSYRLLVADNNFEWMKGLMGVRKLENADGMIFIFPDKQPRTFWNQNTLVDLDIYWMNNNQIVGKSFLPSIKKTKKVVTVSSPQSANRVVEIIRK